jgi:hypothetical protein
MNKYTSALIVFAVLSVATTANAAWYAKFDGVDGSSVQAAPTRVTATTSAPAPARATVTSEPTPVVQAPTEPQAASTDYLLKIEGVDGETKDESASASKVEALSIKQSVGAEAGKMNQEDISAKPTDPAPLTPDFSILLGGGTSEEDSSRREKIAQILLAGARAEGAPVEQISLNFEKIHAKMSHVVMLFGFIPVTTSAQIDVDAHANAEVHLPWWTIFAKTDKQQLANGTVTLLGDVMAASEDALTDGLLIIRSL